jgi:tRNA threonylcarbamoyladenosine biosynthesis protein TsaE
MPPETAGASHPLGHVVLRNVEATQAWGARLSALLRAGDLLVLTGDLGAGKTTLTQGNALASACVARSPHLRT